jgi:hypothetical protein
MEHATQLLSSSTAFTPSPCRPPLLSPSHSLTVEHYHYNGAASSQHCPHSGAAPIALRSEWICHPPALPSGTLPTELPPPHTTGAAYTSHHLDIALPVTTALRLELLGLPTYRRLSCAILTIPKKSHVFLAALSCARCLSPVVTFVLGLLPPAQVSPFVMLLWQAVFNALTPKHFHPSRFGR